MTPEVATVLAALRRQGVAAYRLDAETVRLMPGAAVTPELAAMIRAAKAALLPWLPPVPGGPCVVDYAAIYASLAADVGTDADTAAIRRHAELNGPLVTDELAWLDRRCDRLAHQGVDEPTFRAAVVVLVARLDELRRWHSGAALPIGPRRLTIEQYAPASGPITLADGTAIPDVGRFTSRLLTAVDYALAYPEAAGDAVLAVYLHQLAALGIGAQVEVLQ